jgi:Nodulation protein S (NodS)
MRTAGGAAALLAVALAIAPPAREIAWDDLAPPVQTILDQRGVTRSAFRDYIAGVRARNQARVREGELDELVYYALQSKSFTTLPPIEPALSARAFVDAGAVPRRVEPRVAALLTAIEKGGTDARLRYFREVLARERLPRERRRSFVIEQYRRAMRFLYDKEFVASREADAAAATGRLYQQRGLSTDTSVEAGYLVDLALAMLHDLEPRRRIARVLIVGPGLNVAPRTGLIDEGEPQSYQPFLVIDSLLRHGLADPTALRVTGADINAHVVEWLRGMVGRPPRLTLVGAVEETDRVRFTDDYCAYFAAAGRSIGVEQAARAAPRGRLAKRVDVGSGVADLLDAAPLDIVVDRLDEVFDLVVVTNVFPYLTDTDLVLAVANIARMLAADGILLHNEPRPMLAAAGPAAGLSLMQSRSAIIANVKDAPSPLYDAIWMHRKSR